MTTFQDKEVQLDMAFHDALTAVLALEKWLPGADTHIEISKMANLIRLMEDRAREKHFPSKESTLSDVLGNIGDDFSEYIRAQDRTLKFIKKNILGGGK